MPTQKMRVARAHKVVGNLRQKLEKNDLIYFENGFWGCDKSLRALRARVSRGGQLSVIEKR